MFLCWPELGRTSMTGVRPLYRGSAVLTHSEWTLSLNYFMYFRQSLLLSLNFFLPPCALFQPILSGIRASHSSATHCSLTPSFKEAWSYQILNSITKQLCWLECWNGSLASLPRHLLLLNKTYTHPISEPLSGAMDSTYRDILLPRR